MVPPIHRALAPRFQAVLASAWISKRVAAKYVQGYIEQIKEQGQAQGEREAIAFAPPIQVQVLDIGEGPYEALDAVNGGEDSLFHARNKQNLIYGVSDGVGGWNESGIDPSLFSRSLTAYSAAAAEQSFLLHDSDEADPKDIMRRAFAAMRRDEIPAYGSATELILSLSMASGRLRTAQLGDSTYAVLDARQKARYVSTEQQHRFNMPFQLTIPPAEDAPPSPAGEDKAQFFRPRTIEAGEQEPDDFADLAAVGFDTPGDAQENSHMLLHNEVVVAATDGLFDNVRVDEIEKLSERFMLAIQKIQHADSSQSKSATSDLFGGLAYSIAAQAVANYIQGDLRSPFTGGKPDDVTVMLAWIKDAKSPLKPKL
ncbi:Protein phosphatase 2C 7 [Coemansia sp. RSA 1290]|nr:Protein phosphatase 2C 7 [Coemansia sp. RSA 1290]